MESYIPPSHATNAKRWVTTKIIARTGNTTLTTRFAVSKPLPGEIQPSISIPSLKTSKKQETQRSYKLNTHIFIVHQMRTYLQTAKWFKIFTKPSFL